MKRTRVRYDRVGALVLTAALLVPLGRAAAGAGTRSEPHRTYTVRAGDTLWNIAQRYGDGDPRGGVYEIARANGISGGDIFPGQVLTIP
jgi:LysM repeat protein